MTDALGEARERRAGLRSALGEVERSLASPAAGRPDAWVKTLRSDLQRLSEALDLHIRASEAPGGLLDDIMNSEPRLAHKVERARKEHEELRYRMDRVLDAVSDERAVDDATIKAAREQVVEVLGGIVRHRHLGADLVYEAFSVDIEAGD
jgi:hypothetical protein